MVGRGRTLSTLSVGSGCIQIGYSLCKPYSIHNKVQDHSEKLKIKICLTMLEAQVNEHRRD